MWKILWLDDEFANETSTESLIYQGLKAKIGQIVEIEPISNSSEFIERINEFSADVAILDVMGVDNPDQLFTAERGSKGFHLAEQSLTTHKIPVIVFSGNIGEEGTDIYKIYSDMAEGRQWKIVSKSTRGCEDKLLEAIIEVLDDNPFGRFNFLNEIVRNGWLPKLKQDSELKNGIRQIVESYESKSYSISLYTHMRTVVDDILMNSSLIQEVIHKPLRSCNWFIHNTNNLIEGLHRWVDPKAAVKEPVVAYSVVPDEIRYGLEFFWNELNNGSHEFGSTVEMHQFLDRHSFEAEAKRAIASMVYNYFFLFMQWFYLLKKQFENEFGRI